MSNYLCFTTGDHLELDELEGEHQGLLARALGKPVAPAELAGWFEPDPSMEAPGEPRAAPAAEVSHRMGEFELLSELGRGNMGTVYRPGSRRSDARWR